MPKFEVESVKELKLISNKPYCFVKWKDYPSYFNTWVNFEVFKGFKKSKNRGCKRSKGHSCNPDNVFPTASVINSPHTPDFLPKNWEIFKRKVKGLSPNPQKITLTQQKDNNLMEKANFLKIYYKDFLGNTSKKDQTKKQRLSTKSTKAQELTVTPNIKKNLRKRNYSEIELKLNFGQATQKKVKPKQRGRRTRPITRSVSKGKLQTTVKSRKVEKETSLKNFELISIFSRESNPIVKKRRKVSYYSPKVRKGSGFICDVRSKKNGFKSEKVSPTWKQVMFVNN